MFWRWIVAPIVVAAVLAPAEAAKFVVPVDFSTIQAAIDSATDGDEIVVRPGLYAENLQIKGRNLILRSVDPEDAYVVSQTILDGSHTGPVVVFGGTETETCQIAGFTIQHGTNVGGGGIDSRGCRATIRNNVIRDNDGETDGGGIGFCNGLIADNLILGNRVSEAGGMGGGIVYCHGTIERNVIMQNTAPNGGGLALCRGIIRHNRIVNNTATGIGGGMEACAGTVEANVIVGNTARLGGGVHTGGIGRYVNNVIAGNTGSEAGGGSYFVTTRASFVFRNNTLAGNVCAGTGTSGVFFSPNKPPLPPVQLVNNLVWDGTPEEGQTAGNLALAYCLVEGLSGAADPLFVAEELDDYRLLPGSPAIDAGSSAADISSDADGNARPFGAGTDIGAYEYQGVAPTPRATPTPLATPTPRLAGDVHVDGCVDPLDLLEFARQWQAPHATAPKADVDYSGAVDADDLLLLIEAMRR